jgi:hypothetical protein
MGSLFSILIIIHSFRFIIPSYFAINNIPFSVADRVQYLEEWSSGQGIYEISQLHVREKIKIAI